MSDDVRPVWVSEEHAAYIDRYLGGFKARWDAAPADATKAVETALHDAAFEEYDTWAGAASVALRVLGMP